MTGSRTFDTQSRDLLSGIVMPYCDRCVNMRVVFPGGKKT